MRLNPITKTSRIGLIISKSPLRKKAEKIALEKMVKEYMS